MVRAASPDVLLLQECPTRGFELDPSRYVRCGARPRQARAQTPRPKARGGDTQQSRRTQKDAPCEMEKSMTRVKMASTWAGSVR